MSDYMKLRELAQACIAAGEYLPGEAWEEDRSYCSSEVAFIEFASVATPSAVMALIAENERLRNLPTRNVLLRDREKLIDKRNQLNAEIAGLKTGYEAYEQVNAQLKAEVEKLRKERDARHPFKPFHEPSIGFTGCVICGVYTDHGGLPCPRTRATADAAMGKAVQP